MRVGSWAVESISEYRHECYINFKFKHVLVRGTTLRLKTIQFARNELENIY